MFTDIETRRTQPVGSRQWRKDSDLANVLGLVAREKAIPIHLLVHVSRCRADAARARQIAMYLAHVVSGISLTAIGAAFGRDRTTVSYACGLIEDLRDDPALDAELERLEALILAMGEKRGD